MTVSSTAWQTLKMTTQESPRAAMTQTHRDKGNKAFFVANIRAADPRSNKNRETKKLRFMDKF